MNLFEEIFLLTLYSYPFLLLAKVCKCSAHVYIILSKIFFSGLLLGCFCVHFETEAILIAVGLTAAITFALTIFAFQTKIDFTTCGGKYNSRLLQDRCVIV